VLFTKGTPMPPISTPNPLDAAFGPSKPRTKCPSGEMQRRSPDEQHRANGWSPWDRGLTIAKHYRASHSESARVALLVGTLQLELQHATMDLP